MYSATKHIDGQGRTLGGAVLATEQYISDTLMPFLRHTGPSLSPFNAWVLLKGLETLRLRVDAQSSAAATIAAKLAGHPKLAYVRYPTQADHPQAELAKAQMELGGTVVTIGIDGGRDDAFRFADALELFDISNNLGDTKSLVTHPATTTHRRIGPDARAALGIGDGMVRLSIGLEAPSDLLEDLEQALRAV